MKTRIVLSVMMWCMLFGTLTSCSEGPFSENPEIEDFPESQLGFYNASTVLRDSIETTEPYEAFILLNEDNLEIDQERRPSFGRLRRPPYLYPSGGITYTYPYWQGYLRLAPGSTDVRFMDTARPVCLRLLGPTAYSISVNCPGFLALIIGFNFLTSGNKSS